MVEVVANMLEFRRALDFPQVRPESETHADREHVRQQVPILSARDVRKNFGGLQVLQGVSFDAYTHQTLCLIGPNGAGKTTLFNIIAGALAPSSGDILFCGEPISSMRSNARCRRGIARTFQIPQPFSSLTVMENVEVALQFGHHVGATAPARKRAKAWLERVGLDKWSNSPASILPLGARKKLELVRALATEPRILLLDEVMGGLSPEEVDDVISIIAELKSQDMAVIFVEHILRAVMKIADRIIVLHQGVLIADGTPESVSCDPLVIESYLGGALDPSAQY